jgi:hypothetical protein
MSSKSPASVTAKDWIFYIGYFVISVIVQTHSDEIWSNNIDPETIDGTAPVKSDACFNKI